MLTELYNRELAAGARLFIKRIRVAIFKFATVGIQ